MKEVHTLQLKSVCLALAHLGYNSNPLIILSALPCFSQNRLKVLRHYMTSWQKVFQMSNTCHACRLKRASLVTSLI